MIDITTKGESDNGVGVAHAMHAKRWSTPILVLLVVCSSWKISIQFTHPRVGRANCRFVSPSATHFGRYALPSFLSRLNDEWYLYIKHQLPSLHVFEVEWTSRKMAYTIDSLLARSAAISHMA